LSEEPIEYETNSPKSQISEIALNLTLQITMDHNNMQNTSRPSSPNMVRRAGIKNGKFCEFLESMPWRSLPLAHSISSNSGNKWEQCSSIFSKYLDENSCDAINISSRSRKAINGSFCELLGMKAVQRTEVSGHSDAENTDLEQKILKVFDSALEHIIHNLRDSMTRFVQTEQFKMINHE